MVTLPTGVAEATGDAAVAVTGVARPRFENRPVVATAGPLPAAGEGLFAAAIGELRGTPDVAPDADHPAVVAFGSLEGEWDGVR